MIEDGVLLSMQPDFELELQTKSLLGHRTKIKDLPKLQALLVDRVKKIFFATFCQNKVRIYH